MTKRCLQYFLVFVFVWCAMAGCDGKNFTPQGPDSEPDTEEENPIPVLEGISPTSCVAHVPAFEMTVEGNDFVEGAKIVFRGNEMDTTFVDANHLTCLIQPGDTLLSAAAQAGHYDREQGSVQAANALVKVRNPSPGGGDSNTMDFSICNNYTFSEPNVFIFPDAKTGDYPCIFAEVDGTLDVIYSVEVPSFFDNERLLYLRRSRDGGSTWEDRLQVTKHPPNGPFYPQLIVDELGVMHCVHLRENGLTYYHRSTDGGYNWRKPIKVQPSATFCDRLFEEFYFCVAPGGVIHVLYHADEPECPSGNIFYSRSEDGSHWRERLMSVPERGWCPHIACDNENHVYAAWMHRSEISRNKGQWYLSFSRSDDGGRHWSEPVIWNNSPKRDFTAKIELTVNPVNNHVYMTYYYNGHGYFRKSTDYGRTWTDPFIMAGNEKKGGSVFLTVDSVGNINAFFYLRIGCMFRRSVDGGESWSQPVHVYSLHYDCSKSRRGIDGSGAITVMLQDKLDGEWKNVIYRANPFNL